MTTVLIVEDTQDLRELFVEVLTQEGYKAMGAEHGQQALELLQSLETQPCLVLLDMMMPVMDGAAFLAKIGESHRLAALPIVVVSAATSEIARDGIRRMVKKPVSSTTLIALVREFCGPPN